MLFETVAGPISLGEALQPRADDFSGGDQFGADCSEFTNGDFTSRGGKVPMGDKLKDVSLPCPEKLGKMMGNTDWQERGQERKNHQSEWATHEVLTGNLPALVRARPGISLEHLNFLPPSW
ncbi:hypothetical protein B0H17DRAFT_1134379 [Mycena rosella]|uniref:Uncharacterized protein n=1 Tax=Mycena rosella TaxID=1033263 RepID=A0AAD7DFR5_MYCRO|nr:hypothetical protein B0H17DRAFT_1134379 [Mycena rosella]